MGALAAHVEKDAFPLNFVMTVSGEGSVPREPSKTAELEFLQLELSSSVPQCAVQCARETFAHFRPEKKSTTWHSRSAEPA